MKKHPHHIKKDINAYRQKLNIQIDKQTRAINTASENLEALKTRVIHLEDENPHKKEYVTLIDSLKKNILNGEKTLAELKETLQQIEKNL